MRTVAFLIGLAALGRAQSTPPLSCDNVHLYFDGLPTICQMRETTLAPSGSIRITPGANGGVIVQGWDEDTILVRARVVTGAESESLAEALAGLIAVDTSTGNVLGIVPPSHLHHYSALDLEVHVPKNVEITLQTINGSINVSGMNGPVHFLTTNGGVTVTGAAGNVDGHSINGGVKIAAVPDHWRGQTFDVQTINGAVEVTVPADITAHVELTTRNGNIASAFPMPSPGKPAFPGLLRTVSFDVGGGGSLVRAATTNGTVRLLRDDQ